MNFFQRHPYLTYLVVMAIGAYVLVYLVATFLEQNLIHPLAAAMGGN